MPRDIHPPAPLTPLTSWYDKGCTHFLIGLYTLGSVPGE